jgi:hypothetical protein
MEQKRLVRWNDKGEPDVMFKAEYEQHCHPCSDTLGSYRPFYASVEIGRPEFNTTVVPFNRDLSLCYYLNEDRNSFHLK